MLKMPFTVSLHSNTAAGVVSILIAVSVAVSAYFIVTGSGVPFVLGAVAGFVVTGIVASVASTRTGGGR